ncbi:hypothetical protein QYF36_005236 [Acer negundo]|nr:hypothetical protein QYF36_005236 [Acer negundo]
MGPDEIANLCANMTLLETERPVQLLQVGLMTAAAKRLSLSLVGKVLTNKMVNLDAFASVEGDQGVLMKHGGRDERRGCGSVGRICVGTWIYVT